MSSIFSLTQCKFEADTIVNSIVWSNNEQVAALATNTMNEHEEEIHQIHFMNNEVSYLLVFFVLCGKTIILAFSVAYGYRKLINQFYYVLHFGFETAMNRVH